MTRLPLQPRSCATCPFIKGSPTAWIAPIIAASAMTEATRICHQTGADNLFYKETGKPPAACYGARQITLQTMAALGAITEPTEAAWQARCDKEGIRNIVIFP